MKLLLFICLIKCDWIFRNSNWNVHLSNPGNIEGSACSIQCPQRFIFHAALVHTGNTFFCKQSNVFDHLILQPRIDESVELEPPTHQSKKQ